MNDIGFKRILNPLIEGLGCENFTNPQNVSDDVVAKSKKVVEKIKEETKGKMIALKIDGLTHLNRSFIGVNIQFITDGHLVLRTLATEEMFACHTAANLKDTILFVLNQFDNGRNMVKFVELLSNENIPEELYDDSSYENETDVDNDLSFMNDVNFENKCISVRCVAHTLLSAVLTDKNCSKTIGFARNLVKKLKEKNLRKPPIDCPTLWSSSYKMLAYLVEDAVYHFCSTYAVANSDLYLDQKVWDSICEIESLLEPAEVATTKLQSQNLVFGDFYHI
nr:uncharacterized protein LOC118879545 [Drosophila suzukii]